MDLGSIREGAEKAIAGADDVAALQAVRVKYLGRKGELTGVLRSLKDMPPAERKKVGKQANVLQKKLEALFTKRVKELGDSYGAGQKIDVTKPGKQVKKGHLHPLTQIDEEIRRIFTSMNFSVVEGPEVETAHYNFDALNVPADHPARDMWDTFWLENGSLLRAHTSPVQARYMESHEPPLRIIVPGRCFRYEATDASHETNFHQVEGLMVGSGVTLGNFKYVVEEFLKQLFRGQRLVFRFRPSYFPFVEPGVEVDMKLKGKWLEMMGAGMVNPRVFEAVGYDPSRVRGFAFGMGVERLAMVKYKIPDVRMFYSGDLRFIRQFK
jgi:phenylalanyl-tRNA synthetase alpha chain